MSMSIEEENKRLKEALQREYEAVCDAKDHIIDLLNEIAELRRKLEERDY